MSQSKSSKPIITLVTGNPNKLREITNIIGDDLPVQFRTEDVDLDEMQGDSIEWIAEKKVRLAYETLKRPVLIEDVSMCFNALNGMPGPYIKWFLRTKDPSLLHRMLVGFDDKSATAVCLFSFFDGRPEGPQLFNGSVSGQIVAPRGQQGFGFDPVFLPDPTDGCPSLTFAEMTADVKNRFSHRAAALKKVRQFLCEEYAP